MIALPRPSAAETITGVRAWGRMWRRSTRPRDNPSATLPRRTDGGERPHFPLHQPRDRHPAGETQDNDDQCCARPGHGREQQQQDDARQARGEVRKREQRRSHGARPVACGAAHQHAITMDSITASRPTASETARRGPTASRRRGPKRSVPSGWKVPAWSVASGRRNRVPTTSCCAWDCRSRRAAPRRLRQLRSRARPRRHGSTVPHSPSRVPSLAPCARVDPPRR